MKFVGHEFADSVNRFLACHLQLKHMSFAFTVEAHEFLEAVEEAVGKADDERLEALLCGAVKRLKMSRAKPDLAMCFSLMYLAKTRPSLFQSEVVVEVSH